MGLFDDLIRAEKENPPLIQRILRLYPRFLDRSPDSVNYRHIDTLTSQINQLKTYIYLLRRHLSLNRPIMIWREQDQPHIYSMIFEVDLPNIKNINIWVDDGVEKVLLKTTSEIPPGTHTYKWTYTGVSEETIPTERFILEVETWDDIKLSKGFPENDTPQGDIYDHDNALDTIGEWLGIPRRVYDLTYSEDDLPYTDPPYNTSRTEWDHTYHDRILKYRDKLIKEGFIDAELYRIFEVSPTCEGAWRYCAFQDVNEPQDEKYMEDPEFGYNTIWVHGDHSTIPRNIRLPTPETTTQALYGVSPAGKKVIYELITEILENEETLNIADIIDMESKGEMRKTILTDTINTINDAWINTPINLQGYLQLAGNLDTAITSHITTQLSTDTNITTTNTSHLNDRVDIASILNPDASIQLSDYVDMINVQVIHESENNYASITSQLNTSTETPITGMHTMTGYITGSVDANIPSNAMITPSLSVIQSTDWTGNYALHDSITTEYAPGGYGGWVSEMIEASYQWIVKSVDTQAEWSTLTIGGNGQAASDGTFTVTINSTVFTGYLDPANAWTDNAGDERWSYPERVKSHDGSFAWADLATTRRYSDRLITTGYSFNIPSNARVLGLQARVVKKQSGTVQVVDSGVRLWHNASFSPDNKALSSNWPQTATVYYYGGGTDLWGWDTYLTPAIVNASNFGFYVSAYNGSSINPTAYIDSMKLGLWYRTPSTGYAEYTFTTTTTANLGTVQLQGVYFPVNTKVTITLYVYQDYTWIPIVEETFTSGATGTVNLSKELGVQSPGQYKVRVTLDDNNTATAPKVDKLYHQATGQYTL